MKERLILICVVLLTVSASISAQTPNWFQQIEKIKLLSSTYDDVLKQLGRPVDSSTEKEYSEYFDIPEGRVFVAFGNGLCLVTPQSAGRPIGWKAPEWTVIMTGFSPNKPLGLKGLPFDISKFKRYEITDAPGAYSYENQADGIDFGTNRAGKVDNITFTPSAKFNGLRCGIADVDGDLRATLESVKVFVKTQLPGKWKIFRTFTSSKTNIDICWESKGNTDDSISLEIEAFPDIEKAEKSYADRERFLTFREDGTETINIFDYGNEARYSYIKRFPNYLDHNINVRFRKGRLVVYIDAPSDKIARKLASFISRNRLL